MAMLKLKHPWVSGLKKIILNPGFWLLALVLVLITIPYYQESLSHPTFLKDLVDNLGLERHAFERILYLAPIVWAGFIFGWMGAVVTSVVALVCMLPRAIAISQYPSDAIFETVAVFVVGNLIALSFGALRKEREHRMQLSVLNRISSVVSGTLELSQILKSSADNIMDVMDVDAVLIFLVDEERNELILADSQGLSGTFVDKIGNLKVGEGLNGTVALTGVPAFVEDASADPRVTRMAVPEEKLKSLLIAPLKSTRGVMGTICVAMRSYRKFRRDEMELLTAVGNQIGVAVENARLYESARESAEQIRVSERKYRELFESANDAIWVHDMDGNITSANKAAAELTGYEEEELASMNVRAFLDDDSLCLAREIRTKLLSGETMTQPYEQKLITKQRTEAILELTTNVIMADGSPGGFQHIGRDVTQERRMQENLRFYLSQITKAQEEERRRIARELHDDTIQALVVLARQLDEVSSNEKDVSGNARCSLENLRQQTNDIIQNLRRLSQDLRPPALDRLGLVPALEGLATDIEKHSGINLVVKTYSPSRRLPDEIELVLFRTAQEALRNVWKHSQATSAEIIVEFDAIKSKITIKDNGKGFELPETIGDLVKQGKLGLTGMQERIQLIGGSLKIESKPRGGTTVIIEAPI